MSGSFSAAPAPRTEFLSSVSYAHRGLHGQGLIENSLPAFTAALAAGYGIECDVRLSADGTVFVFHDAELDRLTNETGRFADWPDDALKAIDLAGGGPIPSLATLLSEIDGRTPLLIELKVDQGTRPAPLCAAVARCLRGYSGPVAVMSFHPGVSRWFNRNAPSMARGLVITEEDQKTVWGKLKRYLALYAAQPDFLAYDIRDLPSPFATNARARGMPVLSWTVQSDAQWQTVRRWADAAIFEGEPETNYG